MGRRPPGQPRRRFRSFVDSELVELVAALTHRRREYDDGNVVMFIGHVEQLQKEAEAEQARRERALRRA